MKLGQLLDLLAEAKNAAEEVVAAEKSLNYGGSADTVERKEFNLKHAQEYLETLRNQELGEVK